MRTERKLQELRYTGLQRLRMETKRENPGENVGVPGCAGGGNVVITCAALGNSGLVTAGWTAGAAGRLGSAPAAGPGAM